MPKDLQWNHRLVLRSEHPDLRHPVFLFLLQCCILPVLPEQGPDTGSAGQEVVVSGTVDVYERDGRYQLYAKEIKREGRGDLFLRFEKLRDELEEMGMFDGCYKQPIPKYAKKIGIVTASTGAAIRDIMNITARRNPYVLLSNENPNFLPVLQT